MKAKIVIIEDDESVLGWYRRYMRIYEEAFDFEAVFLETLEKAEEFLDEGSHADPNIIAIIVDGSMIPGKRSLNTLHLVRMMKGFNGIILANSTDSDYRKQLMEEGCTHESRSKNDAIKQVIQILRNQK